MLLDAFDVVPSTGKRDCWRDVSGTAAMARGSGCATCDVGIESPACGAALAPVATVPTTATIAIAITIAAVVASATRRFTSDNK